MKILAIETSCDDTGIAILQAPDFKVLANEVAAQIKIHKKYGGVFPSMAKREHQKNIVPTFKEALKKASLLKPQVTKTKSQTNSKSQILKNKIKKINEILDREPELAKKLIPFLKKYSPPARAGKPDIDYIAVTNGPGLEPCLWVGVNFARALSYFWDIPIIPVNHIEGHILVNTLSSTNYSLLTTNLPAVALVVSGGHTQLISVENIGKYKILGETRDDAAGECFDKAAKILGLGYPGGPEISKLASRAVIPNLIGNPELNARTLDSRFRGNGIKLPRPMLNTKDYDFSFSGLKTAILYAHRKQEQAWLNLDDRPNLTTMKKQYNIEMALEIQQAIIDVLLKKTLKAVKDFNARTIILGGGVSANSELKKQFAEAINSHMSRINLIFPQANLSTDNGLMIAVAGYFNLKNGGGQTPANWKDLIADSNLRLGE